MPPRSPAPGRPFAFRRPSRPGQRATARRWPAESRRALVASLGAGASTLAGPALAPLVAACDPEQLADLVISEGLAGPAHERLGGLLPPGPSSRLATEARRDAVRHLAYLDLLGKFAITLDQAQVTWVALKGPVLAELSYREVPRGYADLDLMVPPGQLRGALSALECAGAVVAEPDWPLIVKDAKGQLSMSVHGLPMVDLHWHLVYLRSARERWAIPTEDLLGRRQRARLKDMDAWALDPHDFLAHLALHASFGAAQQLRRLLDIERTIANQAPDWEILVQRCRAWRVGLPVSVMLNRARQTLGAAVPKEVVEELAGSRSNRLAVHQLSGWSPSGGMPGGRSVKNGFTRSLRDGLLATTSEFAGQTRQAIAQLLRLRATGPDKPGHGDGAGASAGLENYLEMVEKTDRYGHLGPTRSPRSRRRRRGLRWVQELPRDGREKQTATGTWGRPGAPEKTVRP